MAVLSLTFNKDQQLWCIHGTHSFVDPSLDENDFATQLPPLISQLDSIYINECDQASLDTDPHGDWTREEKFHPLKVGDNLNDRRGIRSVSEGSESNLTLDSFDSALWQWRDFARCDFGTVGYTNWTQCDSNLRCGNDIKG